MKIGNAMVLYFSATGNTEYAVKRFALNLGISSENIFSIEVKEKEIESTILSADTLIIAYPNFFCAIPKIMSDYITEHTQWFEGKNIITLVTYAKFSLDTDLLVLRLLRKQGISFQEYSGLSVQLPINVCDMELIKQSTEDEIARLKEKTDRKLDEAAKIILKGQCIHDGKEWLRPVAFLRQRMFYQGRIKYYYKNVKINENCVRCGMCISHCPMKNFETQNKKIISKERCTQCYRCSNLCPQNAITILGRKVQWKYRGLESP
jgi:ferredoxin/flavodoxin